MKKLLTMLLAAWCTAALAQTKSLPEFMASAGFTQVNDSTWTIADRATVTMQDNYVKAFEAKQNHNWTMTFGNGSEDGAVVNVKSGDKITFANGRLSFADGSVYCPASNDASVLFKRSILRSAIFNEKRNVLFVTDIKTVNATPETLGNYIPSDGGNGYSLDIYGNFTGKFEAKKAKEQESLIAKRTANANKMEEVKTQAAQKEYDELCRKYGKTVINGVLSGNIMVGAPMSLIKKMLSMKVSEYSSFYGSYVVSGNSVTETLEFKPAIFTSGEWHVHYYVTYNIKSQCVTSFYTKNKLY